MKSVSPIVLMFALAACSHRDGAAPRSYGDDGLPSAEVTAFQQTDARLSYRDARIAHDAAGCAVYEGVAPDGQRRREPLLDTVGKPICVRP